MAQTILLPTPSMPHLSQPSSPDPTPLRMLAFSVAEAALSSNPNSPMFDFGMKTKVPTPPASFPGEVEWVHEEQGAWLGKGRAGEKSIAERRGKAVWNVLERAKERKEKSELFIGAQKGALGEANKSVNVYGNISLPPSPPISPASYNFILPSNSSLAASIARTQTASFAPETKPRLPPTMAMRPQPPLYTRSVEPSPTKSTFSGLDQTQPPPEFVPRLSASEFRQQSRKSSIDAATAKERRRSSVEPLKGADLQTEKGVRATRRGTRLPSLQQIQAKMSGSSLRRTGSADNLPALTRPINAVRTTSEDSLEILVTPVDEVPNPLRERRLALRAIMNRRPPTPPSPCAEQPIMTKEPSLLPFLRARTTGRLAGSAKVSGSAGPAVEPAAMETPEKSRVSRPVLKVTPPSFESRPAVPPLRLGQAVATTVFNESPTKVTFSRYPFITTGHTTPTESRFNIPQIARLTTPPPAAKGGRSSPASPTESIHSIRSVRSNSTGTNSPSLSMPIITCTPAPPTVVRDGIEQDSDDGSDASGDLIVFDGEAEEREREEREKRGMEMRMKLGLRRRSID